MGYTLRIGQATSKVVNVKDNDGWYETRWTVEPMRIDNAPADGSPTDYTNSRWPSYSAWTDFTKDVGLYDLFYGEEGLLANHPGCAQLTQAHLDKMLAAKCVDPINQGRLDWLQFWAKWAVENCSKPAIANS